jgi:hypothetical protein
VRGAIREAGRVLEPGGTFCFAIVHPLNSAGLFERETAQSPFTIEGSYLDESYYQDEVGRGELTLTLVSSHRPLGTYTGALADAGFVIELLREPTIPDAGVVEDHSRRWTRIPLFLYVRAARVKSGVPCGRARSSAGRTLPR